MARPEDKETNRGGRLSPSGIVAEKEHRVFEEGADEKEQSRTDRQTLAPGSLAAPQVRRSFFEIYKPGQGYHTRIWSAMTMGALVCWFAYFVYQKLSVVDAGAATKIIQVGIPVAIICLLGLFGYWLLARKVRVCDFLIATEGEMKKVNWTTRKDIIGSTKVVVCVVVALGLMLFLVDMFFTQFFRWITVLK
jgi:preprotein translocase subunit SecE